MGSGKGTKIDLPVICYVIAIVLLAVAVALNVSFERLELVTNSLLCAAGSYIIVVLIFLGWSIVFGDKLDRIYAAGVMAVGAIFNIIAGITATIHCLANYANTVTVIGGALDAVAGGIMVLDVLATLGKF